MQQPTPITEKEVEKIMQQMQEGRKPRPKVLFEIGEVVRVKDGPVHRFSWRSRSRSITRKSLRVSVTIFGRATPVELGIRSGREGLTGARLHGSGTAVPPSRGVPSGCV